jgi:opacity protein-like surface antigen
MKKLFLTITFFFILSIPSFAGALEFGIRGGLATPSDKINDIYNTDQIQWNKDTLGQLISKGLDVGYNLGIKMSMPLNDFFSFSGTLGYNSFPESEVIIVNPNVTTDTLATLLTSTKVIPITAGLSLYPFRSIISPYITGELSYNYIYTTVDSKIAGTYIPISTTPSNNRFGFGIGAGVDFNLGILDLNFEGKLNYMNLIGKETSEENKYYATFLIGIVF